MRRDAESTEHYSRDDLPICTISHQVFFSQVQLNCGHSFEERAIKDWYKTNTTCPCCRADILAFNPIVDAKLVQTLLANPEFYEDVYFNIDHFSELVEKKQLSTDLGQCIITILLNSKNHLNEKSDGKSAIEVLAGTEEGCDLLRHYVTIKIINGEAHYYFGSSIIVKENLALMINDVDLQTLLSMNDQSYFFMKESIAREKIKKEEEIFFEKILVRNSFFCPKLFAKNDRFYSEHTKELLQKIANGDEESLKNMLGSFKKDRAILRQLLTSVGTAVDYSGRKISNLTLLQAAAALGDKKMVEIIKSFFYYIQNGSDEISEQIAEIFSDGIRVAFKEQINISGTCFLLNNVIKEIDNATESDIDSALLKQNNHSVLCAKALPDFREDCKKLFCNDRVFNPQHILCAFETYEKQVNLWSGDDSLKKKKQTLLWRQVIGYMQRFLPANYAQVFAQGLYNVVASGNGLIRSFVFGEQPSDSFFPLSDQTSGLGFDFAISSDGPVSEMIKTDGQNSFLFGELLLKKNEEMLAALTSQGTGVSLSCSVM